MGWSWVKTSGVSGYCIGVSVATRDECGLHWIIYIACGTGC